jgi:hypothetical protein
MPDLDPSTPPAASRLSGCATPRSGGAESSSPPRITVSVGRKVLSAVEASNACSCSGCDDVSDGSDRKVRCVPSSKSIVPILFRVTRRQSPRHSCCSLQYRIPSYANSQALPDAYSTGRVVLNTAALDDDGMASDISTTFMTTSTRLASTWVCHRVLPIITQGRRVGGLLDDSARVKVCLSYRDRACVFRISLGSTLGSNHQATRSLYFFSHNSFHPP